MFTSQTEDINMDTKPETPNKTCLNDKMVQWRSRGGGDRWVRNSDRGVGEWNNIHVPKYFRGYFLHLLIATVTLMYSSWKQDLCLRQMNGQNINAFLNLFVKRKWTLFHKGLNEREALFLKCKSPKGVLLTFFALSVYNL